MKTLNQYEEEIREQDIECLLRGEQPTLYTTGYATKGVSDNATELVFSDESEDRMGDSIRASGWDLTNFKRNPVALWSHNMGLPPIGRASNVRVEGKSLVGTIHWDTEDKLGAEVARKFKNKILSAVSVGFKALEFEERQASNGMRGILFKRQELLEISAVSVPANPRALQRAMAEGVVPDSTNDLEKLMSAMRGIKSESAKKPVVNEAQKRWVQTFIMCSLQDETFKGTNLQSHFQDLCKTGMHAANKGNIAHCESIYAEITRLRNYVAEGRLRPFRQF